MSRNFAIHTGDRLTNYLSVDLKVERIDGGGLGVIFIGRDRLHRRTLVLKTMRADVLQQSARVRDRFVREALTWLGLWPHANILTAYNVVEIYQQPFLVLHYARHGSLRQWLPNRANVLRRMLWAQHIAKGLAVLHTPDPALLRPHPLVHRDLKPENVLIDEHGFARITDFGLTRVFDGEASLLEDLEKLLHPGTVQGYRTEIGAVLGTPMYMAPEQWEDAGSATTAVDLYAFGQMLSELFVGRLGIAPEPAQRTGRDAWRMAHLRQVPRSLLQTSQTNPRLPRSLEDLYQACLSKQPEQRPTATQALTMLQAAAREMSLKVYTKVPDVFPHNRKRELGRWKDWATAYEIFGLYQEALERNDRALALAPRDFETLMERGTILGKMGQIEQALTTYDAALATVPARDRQRRKMVWNNRANRLNQVGHYQEAEAAYAQAIALLPKVPNTWSNRASNELAWGKAEAQAGRSAEARKHLQQGIRYAEQAVALSPKDLGSQHNLALLKAELAKLAV